MVKICNRSGFKRALCELSHKEFKAALLQMRQLWEDHVVYTRLAVEETITESPLAGATVQRLLRNQRDLGDNFALFYSTANGDRYADILTRHIQAAVAVLTALITGVGLEAAQQLALANAREFAQFWVCVNPFADEEVIFHHMAEHLATLEANMRAIIASDPEATVVTFDVYSLATREMVDYFVKVIREQRCKKCCNKN